MTCKNRVVALGLDGLSFSLLQKLAAQGIMPHYQALMRSRPAMQMDSVIPTVSSVAWSSFATAKNPGKFGVFGFTELTRAMELHLPDSRDLKSPTIWEILARHGRRVKALSVPLTHPPRSIPDGMLVSCFLANSLGEKEVSPPTVLPFLQQHGYEIDVDPRVAWQDLDRFVEDLKRVLQGRLRTLRALMERDDWDFLFMHVMETDRICHFLLKDYAEDRQPYADVFREFFAAVDGMVWETVERCPSDCAVVILSDHGFCPVKAEVQMNRWLVQEGYLRLSSDVEQRGFEAIEQGSKAFALAPGRIYLTSAGRWNVAAASEVERSALRAEIAGKLQDWKHPETGQRMVRRVYTPEEVFEGPCMASAPDLMIDPEDGFDFKAALTDGELFTLSPVTGMHTMHDAHVWFSEPCTFAGKPRIFDVPALVFETLGVPLPPDCDALRPPGVQRP